VTSSPSLGEGPRAGPLRLVLSAFPDEASAQKVALRMVEGGLAACASMMPVRSVYRWRGKVEDSSEVMVLFKTSTKKVGALFRAVRRGHPYDVPELIELETQRVDEPYLLWALEALGEPREVARAARAESAWSGPRRRAAVRS
jgi:periplasmic divalent cation tolerance protein